MVRVLDPIVNIMRCSVAVPLGKLPPVDAALGMAFGQRPNGECTTATESVALTVLQAYQDKHARRMIFCGGANEAGITEAHAMATSAIVHSRSPLNSSHISMIAQPDVRSWGLNVISGFIEKNRDFEVLIQLVDSEFTKHNIRSVALVAHPLQLQREYMSFRRRFPRVTFYPVESARVYDPRSTQWRVRAEWRFIFWEMIARTAHKLTGKI